MLLEVTRCGEFESEVHSPRNLIGRPGTNGNRVGRKHIFLGYLDAGNTNLNSADRAVSVAVDINIEKGSLFKTSSSRWKADVKIP